MPFEQESPDQPTIPPVAPCRCRTPRIGHGELDVRAEVRRIDRVLTAVVGVGHVVPVATGVAAKVRRTSVGRSPWPVASSAVVSARSGSAKSAVDVLGPKIEVKSLMPCRARPVATYEPNSFVRLEALSATSFRPPARGRCRPLWWSSRHSPQPLPPTRAEERRPRSPPTGRPPVANETEGARHHCPLHTAVLEQSTRPSSLPRQQGDKHERAGVEAGEGQRRQRAKLQVDSPGANATRTSRTASSAAPAPPPRLAAPHRPHHRRRCRQRPRS